MRFVGTEVSGNVTMTAKILEKPTVQHGRLGERRTHGPEVLDPAARAAWVVATTDDDTSHTAVAFQFRKLYNNNTADNSLAGQDGTDAASTTYPQWLRIVRAGSQIEGWQSKDGSTFTKIGGDLAG